MNGLKQLGSIHKTAPKKLPTFTKVKEWTLIPNRKTPVILEIKIDKIKNFLSCFAINECMRTFTGLE